MNVEMALLELFAERYPRSGMRRGGRSLRLRKIFEFLPSTSPDARETLLEALEALAHDGILRICWKRYRRGEDPAWVELADAAALYRRLGRPGPDDQLGTAVSQVEAELETCKIMDRPHAAAVMGQFLRSLQDTRTPPVSIPSPADLADACTFLRLPDKEIEATALRALSVRLFRDSKRLENLAGLLKSLLRTAVADAAVPRDWARLRLPCRHYPVVYLAGSATLVWADGSVWKLDGRLVALSADALTDAVGIQGAELHALSVENKETFHALAVVPGRFDLVLLCGGRPNRAVRTLLALLARSGWTLMHAGDLDPDGLAIAGNVAAAFTAGLMDGKPGNGRFSPLCMGPETFDEYARFGRSLPDSIIRRLSQLGAEVMAYPELAATAGRIAGTGIGIEQEIIDYPAAEGWPREGRETHPSPPGPA